MKTLLERHFDTAFDAPDGIKRLRELILSLAMQGKLVKQDPNDQPASELFKEIRLTRSREAAKGKAGKKNELPPIKPEEIPYELPKGWAWVRLGEIGVWKSGTTPSRSNSKYYGGNIPWVKSGEVKQGLIKHTEEFITDLALEECSLSLNPKGSVLVAMYGANIGEVGILDIEATTNQAVCACHVSSKLNAQYLLNLIAALKSYFISQGAGAAQPNISREKIVATPFPLPPLAEQHRIVAKIDQLMARCDTLEKLRADRDQKRLVVHAAAIKQLLDSGFAASRLRVQPFLFSHFPELYAVKENVAELRKAILQLAVMGKLVTQDPNDESAEDGLSRIAATKLRLQKTAEIGKDKPIEPLQPENMPFEVPESWRWAKLAELTELITKGSSPKWQGITYVPESEGVLFITSENVGNYVLRKLDELKYVTKRFNEIEPRSILKRGDILMNLVGASIGRTAVYDLHDGANINQAVALIRLVRKTDGVCPRFLLHYLNSPSAIDYMLSSRVVNAQPNISLTDAREFTVPIPPLSEQHRIVAKIDQLMALCDAMENQITSATNKQTTLLNALLAGV